MSTSRKNFSRKKKGNGGGTKNQHSRILQEDVLPKDGTPKDGSPKDDSPKVAVTKSCLAPPASEVPLPLQKWINEQNELSKSLRVFILFYTSSKNLQSSKHNLQSSEHNSMNNNKH